MEDLGVTYGKTFTSFLTPFQEGQNHFFGEGWESRLALSTPTQSSGFEAIDMSDPYSKNSEIQQSTKPPKSPNSPTLTWQKKKLQAAVWGVAFAGALLLGGGVYRWGLEGRWRKGIALSVGGVSMWGMRFGSRDQSRYLDLDDSKVKERVQGEASGLHSFADFVRYLIAKRIVFQGKSEACFNDPPVQTDTGVWAWCRYRLCQGSFYATQYGQRADHWLTCQFQVIDCEETRFLTAKDIGSYRLFDEVEFGVCKEQASNKLGCHYLLTLLGEAVISGDVYYQQEKSELNKPFAKLGYLDWVRNRSEYKNLAKTRDLKRAELDRSYREFLYHVEAAYGELRQRGGHDVMVLSKFSAV